MKGLILAACLAFAVHPPVAAEQQSEALPPIPNFTLTPIAGGRPVEMASFRGRPVIVSFWATWCGPCRMELPELERLGREIGDDKLTVVSINLDTMPPAAINFAAALRLELPIYRVEYSVPMRLGIQGLPTTILLDAEGLPARIYEGYTPSQISDLRRRVLEMLGGPRAVGAGSGS